MTYEVRTRVFEGPLDLLLQLITSHQVEITELNLTDLVAEYLAHLELMRDLDLEVTSEFLLIAATLIQLKARHLLPEDTEADLDEELALAEERDRLLARLLAALTFKDVAAVIAHRLAANDRYVPRRYGLEADIVPTVLPFTLPVDAAGLAGVATRVFTRKDDEPDIDHLDLELPSVQSAMMDLQTRMLDVVESDFESLVADQHRAVDVIAYFLAMLELSRWGILRVQQEHREAPIEVRYDEEAAGAGLEALLREEGIS